MYCYKMYYCYCRPPKQEEEEEEPARSPTVYIFTAHTLSLPLSGAYFPNHALLCAFARTFNYLNHTIATGGKFY